MFYSENVKDAISKLFFMFILNLFYYVIYSQAVEHYIKKDFDKKIIFSNFTPHFN